MAEGGKEEFEVASGISEDEQKLLEALHLLGIKPKIGSVEDVTALLHAFSGVKTDPEEFKMDSSVRQGNYQYPKLSQFYGEDGKGEVTWVAFKYEIEALLCDKVFTQEQILLGVRRACKGKAGDKIRRLGPHISITDVLQKFDSDYGSVESREMVMKKFYSCQQKDDESVTIYASRLEEIFDQAIHLQALRRSDVNVLKEVFHAGLKREIKLMSMYQFDKISNYDDFKREIRKLESSISENLKSTCKATVNVDSMTQSKDMAEMKELLKQLNERIGKLEKEKEEQTKQTQGYSQRGRGFRGRSRGYRGRGRGDYRPQRPISNQTFQPTCWSCNEKGHLRRDCPSVTSNIVCYNCQQPGHKQNNCPNV